MKSGTAVLCDRVEVLAYLESLETLARTAAEPNVFYEVELLLPALNFLGEFKNFYVLLLLKECPRGRQVVIGALPLLQRTRQRGGAPAIEWFRSFTHPYCFLGTPLIHDTYVNEAMDCLSRWLDEGASIGRFLELGACGVDGPFARHLAACTQGARQPAVEIFKRKRAIFRKKQSAQQYIEEALRGKSRKKLMKQRRALERVGRVRVESLMFDECERPWVESFLTLEARGWKGRRGTAMACIESHAAFFKDVCARLHQQGRLIMQRMLLGEHVIAQRCAFLAARPGAGAFAFKIAYDEAYSDYSPGVLHELAYIEFLHSRDDISWADSCADPHNSLMNRVWSDRRQLATLLMGSSQIWNRVAIELVPTLQARVSRLYRARKEQGRGIWQFRRG